MVVSRRAKRHWCWLLVVAMKQLWNCCLKLVQMSHQQTAVDRHRWVWLLGLATKLLWSCYLMLVQIGHSWNNHPWKSEMSWTLGNACYFLHYCNRAIESKFVFLNRFRNAFLIGCQKTQPSCMSYYRGFLLRSKLCSWPMLSSESSMGCEASYACERLRRIIQAYPVVFPLILKERPTRAWVMQKKKYDCKCLIYLISLDIFKYNI